MRLLYVTNYQGDTLVRQRGHRRSRSLGASRKVELLAAGLAARGHDLTVLSAGTVSELTGRWFPGYATREDQCGIADIIYLPAWDVPRINLIVASHLLRRALDRAPSPDAVLLYNLEWFFLKPTASFARRRGCPLVVEFEDDAEAPVGAKLESWHRHRGRRSMELARKSASGVIAVSPELSRKLDVGNQAILQGVVGKDLLAIQRPATRSSPNSLRLVYAGGLVAAKGPDLLLEAVQRLPFAVELDIVGTGALLEPLRIAARRSHVPVRVHGEVDRASLVAILANADLAVNPHRTNAEIVASIFPFKIFEYLGSGLPTVTSRLATVPADAHKCLVTYASDTPEALSDAIAAARDRLPDLRREIGAARAWVANDFSSGAAARKAEEVLVRAIQLRALRSSPA